MTNSTGFIFRLFLLFFSFPGHLIYGQFTADMFNMQQGTEKHYKVYSDGVKYRYDFDEGGMKGIVIVDPVENKTNILLPDEKFVHYTEYLSMRALTNDPYQSFVYFKKKYDTKEIGEEQINGYKVRVLEVSSDGSKIFTCWFSDELNFPLRLENHRSQNTYMELSAIKEEVFAPDFFEVPLDFTEVDERMRPVIPEPPAPESWQEIETEIPLSQVFSRGDRIHLTINHDTYTKVILNNETEKPAKIIRSTYKDGIIKPDNEQGPLKYRTNRLYGGEKKNLTLDLDRGEELVIEVHEGQMHIEVKPE